MIPPVTDYEATVCGKIPLHRINSIQPHGALLVLHPVDYTIVQCSLNADAILKTDCRQIHGSRFLDLLCPESHDRFSELLHLAPGTDRLPDTICLRGEGDEKITVQVLLHRAPEYLILEIEPMDTTAEVPTFSGLYQELKKAMAVVNAAPDMHGACLATLEELKKLTGFDRLMMYRFDDNWDGTVIAEIHEPGMESYLGLRFPASDIPRVSRNLYQHSPYRHIPDRDYKPVLLSPVVNPLTGTFTDLSACNLRGVAAVHLEYLRNMGVRSSMSTRLLAQGRLWGLISCHHREPKHLSYEEAAIFELLSDMLSTKVVALEKERDAESYNRLQKLQVGLIEQVLVSDDFAGALLKEKDRLLDFLGVAGVVIRRHKRLYSQGAVPEAAFVEDLILWLQSNYDTEVVALHHLADMYEPAREAAEAASGVVVIPLRPDQGEYIIGFRPEHVREVFWGGNPAEAVQWEADGKTYHPRNSFEVWKQTVRGSSRRWTEPEKVMAGRLQHFLQGYLLREFVR